MTSAALAAQPLVGGRIGAALSLAVLLCGSVCTGLVFVALVPVLPLLAAEYGGGDTGALFAQSVMTMPAIGLIAGGFGSALMIRKFGATLLLMLGLALLGTSGAAAFGLHRGELLLASRLVLGFAASMVTIATTALISARYEDITRARMIGIKGALGAVGSVAGIMIAGELGDLGGWRLPNLLYLFGFVLLALALATIPITRPAVAAGGPTGSAMQAIRLLWPIYLMVIGFGVVLMMTNTQLSFLLAEIGITKPTEASRILVVSSISSAIGGFLLGSLRQWIGIARVLPLAFACWGVGLLLLGFSHTALPAIIGSFLCGFAGGTFVPHMVASLAGSAPVALRDRAIALLYSAIFLGDFMNPLIIQPVSEALTRHGAFKLVGGICILAAVIAFARVMRRPA
ncbi:Predicted arabinose efflux permease, MFS family [Sphingomonas laterariae]|uniref:Predicted arabinose efflux permease, MFS family n=1 Tax=Edaphosphingomonas laterariae TaxID=861865 RepID=A0A239DXV9_9SPHN|nr:MFS transporter [Sphingomonas laterariae]SNS36838.1 Predicted arabinose efflux permease, MFS family [Sphingomonas laterariae]